MTFNDLALIPPIQKALEIAGYENPTPIQAQAIPIILKETDLIGCAQTGTGKTAAFAIPTIQLLAERSPQNGAKRPIRSLILTPTRELAIQIGESFQAYGKFTGLKHLVIFGGVGQKPQTDALRKGIDVLVATPGRLLDLIGQGFIKLDKVEIFTLDEADRMLDMGFVNDVKRVIRCLPEKRQSLFFSATMPNAIIKFANTILTNPQKVEVAPVSSTADTIEQSVFFVDKKEKRKLLHHLLLRPEIKSTLVFTRTKHGANRVVKELAKKDIKAEAIHGNKSQSARQKALKNFKDGRISVLIATDIAARGIDIDELSHVVNFDIPNISETYVHRIGRTGRAGAEGVAFSFCQEDEMPYLRDIQKLIGKEIPVISEHPFQPTFEINLSPGRRNNKPKSKLLAHSPRQEREQPKKERGNGRNSNRKRPDKRTLRKNERNAQRNTPKEERNEQQATRNNEQKQQQRPQKQQQQARQRPERKERPQRQERPQGNSNARPNNQRGEQKKRDKGPQSAEKGHQTNNRQDGKPASKGRPGQKPRRRENKVLEKVDFKVRREPIIPIKSKKKRPQKQQQHPRGKQGNKPAEKPEDVRRSPEAPLSLKPKTVSSLARFKDKWKKRDKKVAAKKDN